MEPETNLTILKKAHQSLKDRLASVSAPERLRRLEIFLSEYVETVQDVKRLFTPKSLPQELTDEVESIGGTILGEVQFYFKNVNKNHTVQMGDVMRQLEIMMNGLKISELFRREMESQNQSNHWHGH